MKTTSTTRARLRYALALLAGLSLAAGAFVALAEPPRAGFAPDPPGHASSKQWVFDVRVAGGKPTIEKARSVTVAQPFETARVMGRYAIELYVGPELLDRIRFNVPLSGDGPPDESDRSKKNPFSRPRFEQVTTRVRVQLADHPRAAYLALVDRATGTTERFDWPPPPDGQLVPMRPAQAAQATKDGGASGDGGGVDGGPDASPKADGGSH
jgi:hypothetical protein